MTEHCPIAEKRELYSRSEKHLVDQTLDVGPESFDDAGSESVLIIPQAKP